MGVTPEVMEGPGKHEAGYFVPLSQQKCRSMIMMLRAPGGKAGNFSRLAQDTVSRLQPDLPVYGAEMAQDWLDEVDNGVNMACLFLSVCGTGALFLATLGVFGLIALSVNQRTREIGIRLALGATRRGEPVAEFSGRLSGKSRLGWAPGLFVDTWIGARPIGEPDSRPLPTRLGFWLRPCWSWEEPASSPRSFPHAGPARWTR